MKINDSSLPGKFADVDTLLNQAGLLPRHIIVTAIEAAWRATSRCTSHHPSTYAGTTFWAEFIRTLRDLAKEKLQWITTKSNPISPAEIMPLTINGVDVVLDPTLQIAICYQTGNEQTGNPDLKANPSNKNPKGPATDKAAKNNAQLHLDFVEEPKLSDPRMVGENSKDELCSSVEQWVVLVHRTDKEIRLEVSLPDEFKDGFICSWKTRICLPSIPLEPEVLTPRTSAPSGGAGGAEADLDDAVRVKKRA